MIEKFFKPKLIQEETRGELEIGIALYSDDFHADGVERITSASMLYPFVKWLEQNPPLGKPMFHESVFHNLSGVFLRIKKPTWTKIFECIKHDRNMPARSKEPVYND